MFNGLFSIEIPFGAPISARHRIDIHQGWCRGSEPCCTAATSKPPGELVLAAHMLGKEATGMNPLAIKLDSALEDRIYEQLQSTGFAMVENAIEPAFLEQLRGQVDQLLDERGRRYFSIIEPQKILAGPFAEMADAPGLLDLLKHLTLRGHSQDAVDHSSLYNVLRIISGDDAEKTAFEFHYDSTVCTIVMPLYIPQGEPTKAGDLIAIPNMRKYRSWPIFNILEKAVLQNRIAFKFYKWIFESGRRNVQKIKPGNLYFFWGYRTFHANLPCERGATRATLLFHFGNPHAGRDTLTNAVLKVRKIREARRLAAA